MEDVEVCAADAGVGDLELHLAGRGLRRLRVDHLERSVADVASSIHMMSLYLSRPGLKDQTNFPSLPSMPRHVEVRTANQQTNGGVT